MNAGSKLNHDNGAASQVEAIGCSPLLDSHLLTQLPFLCSRGSLGASLRLCWRAGTAFSALPPSRLVPCPQVLQTL